MWKLVVLMGSLLCRSGPWYAAEYGASPIKPAIYGKGWFLTFENANHPGNRVGYRVIEHTPIIYGTVPRDDVEAGIDPEEVRRLESAYARMPAVLRHEINVDQKGWVPQEWTFYVAPVADGAELLLKVETRELGLNSYYGIQQCFRMTGMANLAWRQEIARTPAFSEFDYWQELKKSGKAPASLTYVLRRGLWEPLPARSETVGARTPLGIALDRQRTGGDLSAMPRVGPYDAEMLQPIDDGLITRVSVDRTWICAIYWQRTSHVTNHHPADCLHSIVNIGGIPPYSARVVRGKIYWFQGTTEDLRGKWQRDFPANPEDKP